jgi:hypothetical protein
MNPPPSFALSVRSIDSAPLAFLRALCAVAEGAVVASSAGANCVAAVLGDALHRLCILGGRAGMPRSLASVLGSAVVRFLGGFRGKESRSIPMQHLGSIAISRDGSTLFVSEDGVHAYSLTTGAHLRSVGGSWGDGPLQFKSPQKIWIAPDDVLFVAEYWNHRLQLLTPQLDFHGFLGVGELDRPAGVCGVGDYVAVSEAFAGRISVFRRSDGALLRRLGVGKLSLPHDLCVMNESYGHCGHPVVAVADYSNRCISVFCIGGEFLRHVGVGKLGGVDSIACSAFGELIANDIDNNRVVLFCVDGELFQTMDFYRCTSVALHGGAVYAQLSCNGNCVVFT